VRGQNESRREIEEGLVELPEDGEWEDEEWEEEEWEESQGD